MQLKLRAIEIFTVEVRQKSVSPLYPLHKWYAEGVPLAGGKTESQAGQISFELH